MRQTSSDFRGGDKGAGCPSSPSGRLLVLSLLLSESVMMMGAGDNSIDLIGSLGPSNPQASRRVLWP